jgi:hypothetical protein
MILFLTTIKGSLTNSVFLRWESVAYLDTPPPETPGRGGCHIHLLSGEILWVCESAEQILERVPS